MRIGFFCDDCCRAINEALERQRQWERTERGRHVAPISWEREALDAWERQTGLKSGY